MSKEHNTVLKIRHQKDEDFHYEAFNTDLSGVRNFYSATSKRHSWVYGREKANILDACKKCGCVKEIIGSKVTYYLNDIVTDKVPPCEG